MTNTQESSEKRPEPSPKEAKRERGSSKARSGTRASASAVVLKKLTRLPMGELSRFAGELIEQDRECAEFLHAKLDAALQNGKG